MQCSNLIHEAFKQLGDRHNTRQRAIMIINVPLVLCVPLQYLWIPQGSLVVSSTKKALHVARWNLQFISFSFSVIVSILCLFFLMLPYCKGYN